jgi:hypothetical protein
MLFAVAVGSLFVLASLRRVRDVALVVPLLAVYFAVTLIAQTTLVLSSEWARSVAVGPSPSWIDNAVGADREVSVLWYEPPGQQFALHAARHRALWLGEFFNRSVGPVYEIGSPIAYGYELPSTRVRLTKGVVSRSDGRPQTLGDFVVAPCQVRVEGEPIAHDSASESTLYRVGPSVRVSVQHPRACWGDEYVDDGPR